LSEKTSDDKLKGEEHATVDRGVSIMTTIETPSVIRRLWKSTLALGVLTLVVGAAVLVWPGQSIVVAAALFGV